jgi:predicted XRE-type DNA-binding protein
MTEEPVQVFASVWDAIEETPEDAAAMRLRSELAIAVRQAVEGWGVAPAVAATRLGVTEPRLADLMRGRVGRFSLDGLVAMAERAGLTVWMEIGRAA